MHFPVLFRSLGRLRHFHVHVPPSNIKVANATSINRFRRLPVSASSAIGRNCRRVSSNEDPLHFTLIADCANVGITWTPVSDNLLYLSQACTDRFYRPCVDQQFWRKSSPPMSISFPSQQVRSSQRPVPLRRRADLIVQPIDFQGVTHYAIKDPVALTYHRLRGDQYRVLQLLDGRRHLEEIKDELVRQFPAQSPTLNEVQQLITDLHHKGLVFGLRTGQAASRIEQRRKKVREQIWTTLANFLSLRLPGWDPDAVLTWLLRWTRWMFHPVAVALAIVAVLSSWMLLATQFNVFLSRLPAKFSSSLFGWPNLILLWVTLAGAKILHEFGHGLTCKYFGGECHEMGFIPLVGIPTLYCDVSDSWTLKSKWSRILIGAAGMIVEIVLSTIAIFVWWTTEPGLLHYLCLNLFFVTAVPTVIININPLMRLDGYYMLSDYLEIPNLRPKADQLLRDGLSRLCLGIEQFPDPFMPQTGLYWFRLFAVASTIYSWLVTCICRHPDFHVYGAKALWVAKYRPDSGGDLGTWYLRKAYDEFLSYRFGRTAESDQPPETRSQHRRPIRNRTRLGNIPVPADVLHGVRRRTARRASRLHEGAGRVGHAECSTGRPSDRRTTVGFIAGDPAGSKIRDDTHLMAVKRELQLQAIQFSTAVGDPRSRTLAEQNLRSVDRQLAELAEQLNYLTVTAPVSGTIIAPPARPAAKLEQMRTRLVGLDGHTTGPEEYGQLSRRKDSFAQYRSHRRDAGHSVPGSGGPSRRLHGAEHRTQVRASAVQSFSRENRSYRFGPLRFCARKPDCQIRRPAVNRDRS